MGVARVACHDAREYCWASLAKDVDGRVRSKAIWGSTVGGVVDRFTGDKRGDTTLGLVVVTNILVGEACFDVPLETDLLCFGVTIRAFLLVLAPVPLT